MREDQAIAKIHGTRGLQTVIARACNVSPQAVHQWKKVPPHLVHTVAELIDMEPEQIRPDVFIAPKRRARSKR
jgi:Bacterial toxin YdaS